MGYAESVILEHAAVEPFFKNGFVIGCEDTRQGVVIDPDNDDNMAVYGMKANEVLSPTRKWTMAQIPAGVRIFPQTLARYSTRR